MDVLNDDLLHHIASALDALALGHSTGVCRRLRGVTTREQLWSPHLEIVLKELPPEPNTLAERARMEDLMQADPALARLLKHDKAYKDPRRCDGWANCTAMQKYDRVASYQLRVCDRLDEIAHPSNWSVDERAAMAGWSMTYSNYDDRWEMIAFGIGQAEEHGDYGEGVYDELLEKQDKITPKMCAEALVSIFFDDFFDGKGNRDYQLLLLIGLNTLIANVNSRQVVMVLAQMLMEGYYV